MNFKRGKLDNDQLIHFYRSLLLPRMIEDKMLVLLRQGKIGKWFSGIGQEAISVGATLAMEKMNGSCLCIETWGYSLREICP